MIKNYFKVLFLLFISISLNSCATIFGGSKFNAHVIVKNKPNASIYFDGEKKGVGEAEFLVKRRKSDKLEIVIKEKGNSDFVRLYDSKVARPGAVIEAVVDGIQMLGSILSSNGNTIVIPLASTINLISGASWKPDVSNDEITKIDYDNFQYLIDVSEANE